MPSNIDTSQPQVGSGLVSATIRALAATAKSEIEALQGSFADLVSSLASYVTSSSLVSTLASYVTNSSLATSLLDYATKSYTDSLVVGLLDDRGSYDASSNTFPNGIPDGMGNLGGSGTTNAIKKGDLWFIRAAGNLGGVAVVIGTSIRALTDVPGQTAGNWSIISTTLGFTPENITNKTDNIIDYLTNPVKYWSVKGVVDWVSSFFAPLLTVRSISSNETLILTDANRTVLHPSADTTARTFTIPNNASTPYSIGTALTFVNQHGAGILTISISTDSMYLAGTGATGSRTLSTNGIATAYKISPTEWLISGNGLS
jgi:hypothetical protein